MYASPAWQHQQQQQQSQIGSHDPMQIATNPNAFANMFREHLSALTFNSKPIITNLTVIAHEHVYRMANVVAKCLDDHIMQVSN